MRLRELWISFLLAVAACSIQKATFTGEDARIDDATDAAADAAPMIDAPAPTLVTLHETADDIIAPGMSTACSATGGTTSANTWYRAFSPLQFGFPDGFQVTAVTFATDSASASVLIRVTVDSYTGTVGGPTLPDSMLALESTAVVVPPTVGGAMQTVQLAAAVPAGAAIVVQIAAPDLRAINASYYIGATSGAETEPGYLSAVDCNTPTPTSTTNLGGTGHIIIEVSGFAL
jgi:hypothetical protein